MEKEKLNIENKFKKCMKLYEAQNELYCREWAAEIPFFKLPPHISIAVIPSFAGALARFLLRNEITKKDISVYFDAYNFLGFYGEEPYWELFPNLEGDVSRYKMSDIDDLINEAIIILDTCEGEF